MRDLGREQARQENTYSSRLHQTVISWNLKQDSPELTWLPWRIIYDKIGPLSQTPTSHSTPAAALEFHTKFYNREGGNTLHYLHKLDIKTIITAISDYFDHEYYLECRPDIIHASRNDALALYAAYGGAEETCNPNRLFSNEEFFQHYPWVKKLNVNAFYVFLR